MESNENETFGVDDEDDNLGEMVNDAKEDFVG